MSAQGGSASGGRTLVVFYSRTGTTRIVGEIIAQKLGADVEEIKDTMDRGGVGGYLRSGRDAMKRNLTKLEPVVKKPSDYDLVIIGTPIWGWNMSVPIRTYLTEQKNNIQNKVAFFCTMGGSGDKKAFSEMEEIIGKKTVSVFSATTKEVVRDEFLGKLEKFIREIGAR